MDHLDDFLIYLQAEKRYSGHTVRAYGDDVRQFMAFCLASGDGADNSAAFFDPAAVRADDLRRWIMTLTGPEHRSATTVNRKISSVKSFYRYLRKKKAVEGDLFLRITSLKTPKRLPSFVEESRMKRLTDSVSILTDDFLTERDSLIILLFYATGIRLAELVGIRISDFSENFTRLKVRGKGDKERTVPLMGAVSAKINGYLALIEAENICESGTDFVFLTDKGKPLGRTDVYRIVRSVLQSAGVQGKASPHVLRHTFATHLLNAGMDIRAIQELLGHSSLGATQVYTHNSIAQLKQVYNHTHPRAKK